jgi:hypothetical protein
MTDPLERPPIEVLMSQGDVARIEDDLFLCLHRLEESTVDGSMFDPSVRCNWNPCATGHFRLMDAEERVRKSFRLEVVQGKSKYGYVHFYREKQYIIRSSGRHGSEEGVIGILIY